MAEGAARRGISLMSIEQYPVSHLRYSGEDRDTLLKLVGTELSKPALNEDHL